MLAVRKVTETASFKEQSFPFEGNTRSTRVYISRFVVFEISLVCWRDLGTGPKRNIW